LQNNDAAAEAGTTDQIMKFNVVALKQEDTSTIPNTLCPIERLDPADAVKTRDLTIIAGTDRFGREMLLLNNRLWEDPITEDPKLGTIEIWRLINMTREMHPIHLHLVRFLILDRQPFDVERYRTNGELVFTGPAEPPEPFESGLKDTVRAPAGYVTRIIARFCDFSGKYVWHCHILEHEDHEMMRPYVVVEGDNCEGRE